MRPTDLKRFPKTKCLKKCLTIMQNPRQMFNWSYTVINVLRKNETYFCPNIHNNQFIMSIDFILKIINMKCR